MVHSFALISYGYSPYLLLLLQTFTLEQAPEEEGNVIP